MNSPDTPRSRSRSNSTVTDSSDTTMLDSIPDTPAPEPIHSIASSSALTHPLGDDAQDPNWSLLLSLPRELRDRVYTYALHSPSPFWWPSEYSPSKPHDVSPNLILASRQLYAEACPILYSSNKFLFTHPSDCNMFRTVSSSDYSALITSMCFRIRERDLRLWTSYLGSGKRERSLLYDLPHLRSLWIFLRCGNWGPPALVMFQNGLPLQGQHGGHHHGGGHHHHHHHHHHGQGAGAAAAAAAAHVQNPPIPPPPPVHVPGGQPGGVPQGGAAALPTPPGAAMNPTGNVPSNTNLIDRFFRWERNLGLENLCLSLKDKTPEDAEVKIVCIQRLFRQDVRTLARNYPEELTMDAMGDARTRFRRVWGVEVSLELSAIDLVP